MSQTATRRRYPRLWMVFGAVSLVAFALALGGFILVRVYDRELIRQTESELIAQGAAVASVYRAYLEEAHPPADYGLPATTPWPFPRPAGTELSPILPSLRASDEVQPASEDPPPALTPADAYALAAGARVAAVLPEISRATLAGIRVVSPDGVVVASSKAGLGGSLTGRDEVRRALRGEPNSLLRLRGPDPKDTPLASLSRDAGLRVTLALPVLSGGRVLGAVVLSRTPMTPAKALYADRWNLTATALLLLGMVALVSAAAAAYVVRPVRALVRQTRAIAAQAPEGFSPMHRPVVEEVAELSEAFAAMAVALRERNDYLRSFAANVSHEFKTPLAAIRGAVELLRDHAEDAMPAAQRARFLMNIEQDAERLTRLTQSLLELARADAMPSARGRTPVGPLLTALAERCGREGPALTVSGAQEDLAVTVPAEVLESVLWELMVNARQHGGAQAKVTLTVEADAREVRLTVQDNGPGVSEANQARVFDAFFTTARDRGGTGMGLTISRSLLRPFGGRLELVPGAPAGARFSVAAPRA